MLCVSWSSEEKKVVPTRSANVQEDRRRQNEKKGRIAERRAGHIDADHDQVTNVTQRGY